MRIKLSSLVLVSLISNNAVGDCFNDGYNTGYSKGLSDGQQSCPLYDPPLSVLCESYCSTSTSTTTIIRKEGAAKLENDLTLTLPILLDANGKAIVSDPTKLKYYPKGLITSGTTPQGTHAFSVDSLGGNPLPNPSAKATVRLLIVNGKFSSAITPTITNDSNNSSTPTFSCNATLNSCEMELNFGNGNENLSIPTPQNATWLGDCTNTDLSKSCNIGINKPYQTVVLIY